MNNSDLLFCIYLFANVIYAAHHTGPFMPCQDLFDWWSLRVHPIGRSLRVWIVFLMALLGNGAVVFVLIFARSKIDVPRFLVCNLGMADFFMGIYLGFLAVVDASTLGEFRMYAIPWQLSAGCQVSFGAKHIRDRNFLFYWSFASTKRCMCGDSRYLLVIQLL